MFIYELVNQEKVVMKIVLKVDCVFFRDSEEREKANIKIHPTSGKRWDSPSNHCSTATNIVIITFMMM